MQRHFLRHQCAIKMLTMPEFMIRGKDRRNFMHVAPAIQHQIAGAH